MNNITTNSTEFYLSISHTSFSDDVERESPSKTDYTKVEEPLTAAFSTQFFDGEKCYWEIGLRERLLETNKWDFVAVGDNCVGM